MKIEKITLIENMDTAGIIITAVLSPCCFPLFGIILTSLGLGSIELFGSLTIYVFLTLLILSFIGSIFSFLYHKKILPTIITAIGGFLILFNYYFEKESYDTMYWGIFGLLIASLMNYYETKIFRISKTNQIIYDSILKCPNCGFSKKGKMPTDSCQFFYECENCKSILKPKNGDCCVYCSYGTVKCPSIQENKNCC